MDRHFPQLLLLLLFEIARLDKTSKVITENVKTWVYLEGVRAVLEMLSDLKIRLLDFLTTASCSEAG